ncbi:MAG: hypothetical protein ACRCSC_08950, partial [Lactococcus garvieae]
MSNSADEQKYQFSAWATENLGEKTGIWYSPYLERLGVLLKQFELNKGHGFYENFFYYRSFEEFKEVYKQLIGQNDEDISKILKGKQIRYPDSYAQEKL